MRRLSVALLFVLGSLNIYCQSDFTNAEFDSISAQYYKLENWGELIKIGESSINNGYSNYYIEIRLAIAKFSTG